MEGLKNVNKWTIKRYSRYVISAVELGVDMDDIIQRTRRYHGNDFTEQIVHHIQGS